MAKREEKNTLLEAKEMRRLAHEQKQVSVKEDTREEFRKFFVKLKTKYELDGKLENVMWLHFKAAGFDKKEKFQDGVFHFGLR